MRHRQSVDIRLGPSRVLALWIVTLHLATAAIVVAQPIAAWARYPVGGVLVVLGVLHAWNELAGRRRGISSLALAEDRTVAFVDRAGQRSRGRVAPTTYVGDRLVVLHTREDGRRFCRTDAILADMLSPDDFRRLKVLLRLSRAPADDPESEREATG